MAGSDPTEADTHGYRSLINQFDSGMIGRWGQGVLAVPWDSTLESPGTFRFSFVTPFDRPGDHRQCVAIRLWGQ